MVALQPETLSLASVLDVLSLKGLYILGYGWLFGMCKRFSTLHACRFAKQGIFMYGPKAIWVTFIGGRTTPVAGLYSDISLFSRRRHCF